LLAVELQPESPTLGGQVVLVMNPADKEINLGCWKLHSNTTNLTLTVEPDLRVPANTAIMVVPEAAWLGVTDQIQLLNQSGTVVDQTPELRDNTLDDQLWFRNATGAWSFGRIQFNINVIQGHLLTQQPSGC